MSSFLMIFYGCLFCSMLHNTAASCSRYGHSCWGAHGKRSGGSLDAPAPSRLEKLFDDEPRSAITTDTDERIEDPDTDRLVDDSPGMKFPSGRQSSDWATDYLLLAIPPEVTRQGRKDNNSKSKFSPTNRNTLYNILAVPYGQTDEDDFFRNAAQDDDSGDK